jgi:hypothetical protein
VSFVREDVGHDHASAFGNQATAVLGADPAAAASHQRDFAD